MIPWLRRLPVPWPAAAVLAVALSYVTGFWLTSLQGAVGAVTTGQNPFAGWLLHSTLMLPVFLVAVVVALVAAGRRFAGRTLPSALAVTGMGTLAGIVEVAASTLYDYQLQVVEIQTSPHFHTGPIGDVGSCDSTCVAVGLTFGADARGVLLTAGVLLVTNLLLVGWIVTMRGGRLTAPARVPEAAR